MKITDVQAVPVWGGGGRNFLFVVIDTDEGVSGVGEAGLTGREQAVCGAVEHYRPLLVGEDPFRTAHLWQLLARGGFFPAQSVLSAAVAAIDIALWDVKGKALGVSVADLLGGPVRDVVPAYAHVEVSSGGSVVDSTVALAAAGWRAVRLALPGDGAVPFEPRDAVRAAIAEVGAVREAVGDGVEIILDVHTRLDLPEATWLCRELEPLHPLFIEDALRCENLDAYRRLRERTGVPLAAGEQLGSKWEFRTLVENELVDYARIDLCIAGGFTEAVKIAALCETHHIKIAVHNPLGPVSTAAAVQFNLACVPFGIQEQPRLPGTVLPELFRGQSGWRDGALLPPDGAGLGLDFDRAAAAEHPPRWTDVPRLTRRDGSFTNW